MPAVLRLYKCLGVICATLPSYCYLMSPRKLFYLMLFGRKNAISVYCMSKVMGVIFHPARIGRLMKADGEGKVLNKRGLKENEMH